MAEDKPPEPPKRDWADFIDTGRKWQQAFIALIIVLIVVAGGAFYWTKHKTKPQNATQTTHISQAAAPKISSQTKHYSSPNFYLTLDYPNDWTLTDSGGGVMMVISPATELTSSTGQKVTGQIALTFRNSGQALPEFDKGNANAVVDSVKIAYTHPSQNQRANTYMSFLTYASSTGSGIDGIYITGDYGYKKDQAIPKVDIQKIDPIVSITFAQCADKTCGGKTTPLNISLNDWKNTDLSNPLTKLLESLQIT